MGSGEGTVAVNMPKAHTIHVARIRMLRDQGLVKLDVSFTKEVEKDDAAESARLATGKQKLWPVGFPRCT